MFTWNISLLLSRKMNIQNFEIPKRKSRGKKNVSFPREVKTSKKLFDILNEIWYKFKADRKSFHLTFYILKNIKSFRSYNHPKIV